MSALKIIFLIIAVSLSLTHCATAQTPKSETEKSTVLNQSNIDSFRSGGGFKIDLPKPTLSKEVLFDDGKLSGRGKTYYWENPQGYEYRIAYYKLDNRKKSLTEIEKTSSLANYQKQFLQDFKAANIPFIEKKYVFNGSNGIEIQAINSAANSKMLTRFFIVGWRFYFIDLVYNPKMIDDSEVLKIADSFALLDSQSLIDAKIEEVLPEVPPQEPVIAKLKTDAQDYNLKGKVKSVIEDNQDRPNRPFKRLSEQYYNEKGNLVKEMEYDGGYPDSISLWGYIDGKRITRVGSIEFDDDQREPSEGIRAIMEDDSTLPKDARYDFRYEYKYNNAGQLIQKITYSNNGKISVRTVYNYKGNQREELNYGDDGQEWSQTVEILDKNGNVIERNLMAGNGKVSDRQINTYEFDSNGNWILMKTVEKKIVKGKEVLEPLWTSKRTITYYP